LLIFQESEISQIKTLSVGLFLYAESIQVAIAKSNQASENLNSHGIFIKIS